MIAMSSVERQFPWRGNARNAWIVVLVLLGLAAAPAFGQSVPFDPCLRAARHAIEVNRPAVDFFEGAVLGNGGLGAVVTTRPDAVVVHFGHNDVWDIRLAEKNREKLGTFEEVWTRVKRGGPDFPAWFKNYCKIARENYSEPYPRPWPCGTVLFGFDRRRAELLGHRVRIDDGVCEVRFLIEGAPAVLELFTELSANRFWMRMLNDSGQPVAAPFTRARLVPEDGMATTTASAGSSLEFRQTLPVLGPERHKDKVLQMTLRAAGRIDREADALRPFVACIELNHGLAKDIPQPSPQGRTPTLAACEQAVMASRRAWRDYWSRSGVILDDELLERVWYRNLYFLNCGTKAGAACPGLFANWSHQKIGTAWHGDYHTNYNLQQPFWVAFSSNHVEKHLPYVDLVHFLLPVSQGWAKGYFNLPGAYFPHSAYPVEMKMLPYPVPTWGLEVCETPWTVQSLWWHYLYTMDREFLRTRAFGPLREAVTFMNAYMRRADAHGSQWKDDKFHIYPTVVPELGGLTADPRKNADCLVDLTLTKFLFRAYLESCRVLDCESKEADLMREVREILSRFPEYPMTKGQRGTVFVSVAAEDPEVVYNTPNSLMTVFPGEDHGLHSPPAIRSVLENTWRNQRNEGGNELVFLNLQGARLGVLDIERFKRQINYCMLPNGT
jgi:hypothetical protein